MTREEMLLGIVDKQSALDLSIEKWKDIVYRKGQNLGFDNCALCHRFLNQPTKECTGCVIFEHTHQRNCHGTPYTQFNTHVKLCEDCDEYDYCTSALELAKEEMAFLESLKEGGG